MTGLLVLGVVGCICAAFAISVIAVCIFMNSSHKRESQTLQASNRDEQVQRQYALDVMNQVHERDSQMVRDGLDPVPINITPQMDTRRRLNG